MESKNELYPIFLKVHALNVLIVGGGNVGLEKLSFMLKSSPRARVEVLAPLILPELEALANKHNHVSLLREVYSENFLDGQHLVIAATDDLAVNKKIYQDARSRDLLVNVADTPDLCDFYLGGIVTKGHVKIAISTNGKSPTTAKRLRQFFEAVLPERISDMVESLNAYRKTLRGDFEHKVTRMNEVTATLIEDANEVRAPDLQPQELSASPD